MADETSGGIELAKAYVQIVPSAQGIGDGIAKILGEEGEKAGASSGAAAAKGFGSTFGSTLQTVGAVAGTMLNGVSILTDQVVKGASAVAEVGDEIDKESQKLGISAEAYQEWDAILQHSGSSAGALSTVMRQLTNKIEDGSGAFEKIGISAEQLGSMSREQIFGAVISGLQGMSDEQERAATAQDLLGRGAQELGALLNTSAEETEAMRRRVHELGGVLSDEAVKSAANFGDQLQDMQTSITALKNKVFADFLPGLSGIMDGLADLFSGNGGLEKITEGVGNFIQQLSAKVPEVMKVGGEIIGAIGEAILTNLPALVESGLQVISELAKGIGEALPELTPTIVEVMMEIVDVLTDPDVLSNLLDAALKIILGLAEGLIKSIPKLLEKVPEIIKNLVSALVSAAPQLLAAGVQLIVQLGLGLIEAIPELVLQIPKLIAAIVGGILEGTSKIFDVGKDLMRSLWNGIKSMWQWLVDQVTGLFKNLGDAIKNLLGLDRFFENGGKNAAVNFWSGFNNESAVMAYGVTGAAASVTRSSGYSTGSGYAGRTTNNYNVTIDAKSVREFNDVVSYAQNAARLGRQYG